MLEEIENLTTENGFSDILKVYLVQEFNVDLLKRLLNLSSEAFGEAGMDEWGLVPQIRHGNVFVLKEEGSKRIIGIAVLMRDWEDIDKAYLFDFAIAEKYQGQGLGPNFLQIICSNLKEQGFKRLSLTVDADNKPAIHLYEDKIGFHVVKFNKNEYGQGQDRYIMELDLETSGAIPSSLEIYRRR
ncbi:MAG: GNAT family N-acetyltransferase [Desulfitobacteriaceae bacterium]